MSVSKTLLEAINAVKSRLSDPLPIGKTHKSKYEGLSADLDEVLSQLAEQEKRGKEKEKILLEEPLSGGSKNTTTEQEQVTLSHSLNHFLFLSRTLSAVNGNLDLQGKDLYKRKELVIAIIKDIYPPEDWNCNELSDCLWDSFKETDKRKFAQYLNKFVFGLGTIHVPSRSSKQKYYDLPNNSAHFPEGKTKSSPKDKSLDSDILKTTLKELDAALVNKDSVLIGKFTIECVKLSSGVCDMGDLKASRNLMSQTARRALTWVRDENKGNGKKLFTAVLANIRDSANPNWELINKVLLLSEGLDCNVLSKLAKGEASSAWGMTAEMIQRRNTTVALKQEQKVELKKNLMISGVALVIEVVKVFYTGGARWASYLNAGLQSAITLFDEVKIKIEDYSTNLFFLRSLFDFFLQFIVEVVAKNLGDAGLASIANPFDDVHQSELRTFSASSSYRIQIIITGLISEIGILKKSVTASHHQVMIDQREQLEALQAQLSAITVSGSSGGGVGKGKGAGKGGSKGGSKISGGGPSIATFSRRNDTKTGCS